MLYSTLMYYICYFDISTVIPFINFFIFLILTYHGTENISVIQSNEVMMIILFAPQDKKILIKNDDI
jgi:hypothetical protein